MLCFEPLNLFFFSFHTIFKSKFVLLIEKCYDLIKKESSGILPSDKLRENLSSLTKENVTKLFKNQFFLK